MQNFRTSPLLLQLLLLLSFLDVVLSEACTAGYSEYWLTHPDLLTLIDASKTTSNAPDDLKGTGMSWSVDVNGGTVSHMTAAGEVGPY